MPYRSKIRPRKSSTARGSDSRQYQELYTWGWTKLARRFRKANPYCAMCAHAKRYTPCTCVDHIKPHCGNVQRFWDVSNLQALCTRCHDIKTKLERSGRIQWWVAGAHYVVSGPGVQKRSTAAVLSGNVFDLDHLVDRHADLMGMPGTRPAHIVARLKMERMAWLQGLVGDEPAALIVESHEDGYDYAEMMRGRLITLW